jgi:hypothetical protein
MSSSHDQECNEKISYYFDQICILFEESSLKILQSYSAITFVYLSPSILIMYFFYKYASQNWFQRWKPVIYVMLFKLTFAGLNLFTKLALNKGMSNFIFVFYRNAVASFAISPFAYYFERYIYYVFFQTFHISPFKIDLNNMFCFL